MDELEPVWEDAPRHAPGLELPAYRFVPEMHPHPRRDPAGSLYGVPEPAPGLPPDRWREDASYLGGIDLYHQGYLWEAHEFWEAGFHGADDPAHRALLQALIQLAAALLNVHRGKAEGVRFLTGAVVRRLTIAADAVGPAGRLAGLSPRELLADVQRHFSGALADDGDPLATIGPAPRLRLLDRL